MLLKNKNAIIYGAGGSIGGAVARAFAREGAKVFVTGRSEASLDKVVDEIVSSGGNAVAAKAMMMQGSGVILSLTATPGGLGYAMVGGFGPACAAMESFSRDLAAEVGVHGVRVANIR